jgi:4-aminobutyrate aminotransferase/(S)-3-amino-2-methylpropionate transaminase
MPSAAGSAAPDTASLREDRARFIPRGMASSSAAFAVAGEGAWLTDSDGRRYLDFATGISVLNVGHRHPAVQAAIQAQLDSLVHSGAPVMMPAVYVQLARRLAAITPGAFAKKVLLVNSGAEAVENAVKIVRQATGRSTIFTFQGAFHGRTLLTMAMTGKVRPYRQQFGPYPGDVHHLPYPNPYRRPAMSAEAWTDYCLDSLRAALVTEATPDQVAAVFVEPVQGEGGFIVPPAGFLPRLAGLCREQGILLVVDEIQTGFGRTGAMFASEHESIEPDVILAAKSIAGGLPLAAVIGRAEIMDAVDPGGIGGTYGGNALACAAALAVIDVIERDRLPERARSIGARIQERMRAWQQVHQGIGDVRGLGAMVAMELVTHRESRIPDPAAAAAVVHACEDRGLLVLKAGAYDNVVRLLPPLIVSDEELEHGLATLEEALSEVLGASVEGNRGR